MVKKGQKQAEERWLKVPGFEARYEVSDHGRVRLTVPGRMLPPGAILKQTNHNAGYLIVSLQACGGHCKLVHRLVAEAFLGPIPEGHEVNHINGDKHDNRLENLEFMTRRQNIHHACRLGLMRVRGEENPRAKSTEDEVRRIREAHAAGEGGYKSLGIRFGKPWGTIRNIVKGRTWASVTK